VALGTRQRSTQPLRPTASASTRTSGTGAVAAALAGAWPKSRRCSTSLFHITAAWL
jgi:hypothetical protein